MSSKESKKWMPFFIIAGTVVGFSLGSFLFYLFKGEFPYEVLVGSLAMAIVLAIVEILRQGRKKDNLPDADERVIRNIFNYFAYTSHIFLAVLFIGIAVLTLFENETISVFLLTDIVLSFGLA